MSKQATITASDLQRQSGSVLRRVALDQEHLVIERSGYPVAVLLSYQEYEELMRERALAQHRDLVMAMSREAERQNLKQQVFEALYGQRPA